MKKISDIWTIFVALALLIFISFWYSGDHRWGILYILLPFPDEGRKPPSLEDTNFGPARM